MTKLPQGMERRGVLMTEDSYGRIQTRIKREMGRWAPVLWVGGAFAALGVAASAVLAYVVLPKNPVGLPVGVRTTVVTIAISAGVIFVVCGIGTISTWLHGNEAADDICNEMDTYSIKYAADTPAQTPLLLPPGMKPGGLAVRSGLYGSTPPGRTLDVTQYLRHQVTNDHLDIPVDNQTLAPGDDPAPGIKKKLVIEYDWQGISYVSTFEEGSRAVLP